ncbi:MAG: TonB-dependent receptor, partial [Candidatus Marinimicrobia bacterium]|nr:TonB-dependent receptor [Candidatus Neomarinimicrobiota bacterium]
TVMYELGLQQQLSVNNSVNVTIFYRDIMNWLSSEYNFIDQWDRYTRYVTQDYGNVRGVTFSYTQRSTSLFTLNLDYTYQLAEGNASSPDAQYYDNQSIPPVESEKYVIPLDWDVRHSINTKIMITPRDDLGFSLINRFETGRPYTPQVQGQRNAPENSARKPYHFTTDFRMYKYFNIGNSSFKLIFKVYNLFDRKNERYVFNDTGRAGSSLVPTYAGQSIKEHSDNPAIHSLNDWLYRPTYYSNPRQILLRLVYNFSMK